MKRSRVVPLLFAFAFTVFIGQGSSLYAQEDDPSKLRSRVSELELRVKQLEALLKACEESRKPGTPDQIGWQNKKNWRRLSKGMQEGQVKGLLGEPSKVIQGVKTLWYYPNIYCGYVTFDDKGKVIGWNEP
ncbi:MAG: hypothetical protein JXL84_12590 [Deltaproteobacteria bacterium]|nr:hypothetical protein [Deltaproteobacteria bacterium]